MLHDDIVQPFAEKKEMVPFGFLEVMTAGKRILPHLRTLFLFVPSS